MRNYNLTIKIPVVLDDSANTDDVTRSIQGISGIALMERLGLPLPAHAGTPDILMEAVHGVDVTCYGVTMHWSTRQAAIKFYTDACNGCDPASSEHSRYSRILTGLLSGETEVSDE